MTAQLSTSGKLSLNFFISTYEFKKRKGKGNNTEKQKLNNGDKNGARFHAECPTDDQLLICLLFQPDIIVVCTVSIYKNQYFNIY